MKIFKDKAEFDARIESLGQEIAAKHMNVSDFTRPWTDGRGFNPFTVNGELWNVVMKEFVPLIAGAIEFGRPDRFTHGRSIWNIVDPNKLDDRFSDREIEMMVEDVRRFMDDGWRKEAESGFGGLASLEKYPLGYRRYRTFADALKKLGVTRFKLELTDRGMSPADIRKLENAIAEVEARIGNSKEPPAPREPLFDVPKKGKQPKFDDTEYAACMEELRSKYLNALRGMTGFSGMSLREDHVQELQDTLAGFDYTEVSVLLGAQKRWPPGDHAETYEFLATLPQQLAARIEEQTAKNVEQALQNYLNSIRAGGSAGAHGFLGLRHLKMTLAWLTEKFPQVESAALARVRAAVAKEFDPRWATMSAGPLHEKYRGEIRFSASRALPLTDEWPEAINPVKESIYAHVFLDCAMKDLAGGSDMLFLEAGNERYQFSVKALGNPDSAYVCLGIHPEDGRNPDLIRTVGKALAAADGELEFVFTPIAERSAVGTLKLKMTKADAGKLAARTEALAVKADANRTAAAILPETFAKAQKWPYKDPLLAPERLVAAIEEAWEYNSKEQIKVRHLRVNHYRPGYEWDQEVDPLNRPTQRLTFSYAGMIFEKGGKTYCVEDGIQFRQFYMIGKGYGDDLNVLFWGAKPFALPPEQVKRIAE